MARPVEVAFDVKASFDAAEKASKDFFAELDKKTKGFVSTFREGSEGLGGFRGGAQAIARGAGFGAARRVGLGPTAAAGVGAAASLGIGAAVTGLKFAADKMLELAKKAGAGEFLQRAIFPKSTEVFAKAGTALSVRDQVAEALGPLGKEADPQAIRSLAKGMLELKTQEREGMERTKNILNDLIGKDVVNSQLDLVNAVRDDLGNVLKSILNILVDAKATIDARSGEKT